MILDLYSDIIPLGKYKGKTIGDVVELKDFGYLLWLLTTLNNQRHNNANSKNVIFSDKFFNIWKNEFETVKGYRFSYDKYNNRINDMSKSSKSTYKGYSGHVGSLALQDIDYASECGYMEQY
jgi:hypothetical protein